MKHLVAAAVLAAQVAGIGPARAQDGLEAAVIAQLRCADLPDPLPVLEALERTGKIRAAELYGYDSISCFPIHGGLRVAGMEIAAVCAHEETKAIRERRPDLLYWTAGTSPGQLISFGADVSPTDAEAWYRQVIGPAKIRSAIEDEYTVSGKAVEISCSSWISG